MPIFNSVKYNLTGWIPDVPDFRDHYFKFGFSIEETPLPPKVDLRKFFPMIWDQGTMGCCTSMAISASVEFNLRKQKITNFTPSPLFAYYNGRIYDNTTETDAGAKIRNVIKGINQYGICHLNYWPTFSNKITTKPSKISYKNGNYIKEIKYERVPRNLKMFKCALAFGFPFVFGLSIYESFLSDSSTESGIISIPDKNERLLGGQTVLACGYDDSTGYFIIRNSWGPRWGDKGYCYLPYQYLMESDLSDDFWIIYPENIYPSEIENPNKLEKLGWVDF